MTQVVHKRYHKPTTSDVYIGRPSIWGNPFVIGRDGQRDEVCDRHEAHLRQRLARDPALRSQLLTLRGKTLVCFCKPARCHGDTLVKLIEELSQS